MFHQAMLHRDPEAANRFMLCEIRENHEDVVAVQFRRDPIVRNGTKPFRNFSAKLATSRSGICCARTFNGLEQNPRPNE
jgi:hypothetical protein